MNITFEPLAESHFQLLLQWLRATHVKAWWDQDVNWTQELIIEKYSSYIEGWWQAESGQIEKIDAFVICVDANPIGYIQQYDASSYLRAKGVYDFPNSLAGIDIFIGDAKFIGKNIGSQALGLFIDQYCAQAFEFVFVDPKTDNIAAIRAYSKAGFKQVKLNSTTNEMWMMAEIKQ